MKKINTELWKPKKMRINDINSIEECFKMILRGDKENSRLASRKVKKLLYNPAGRKSELKKIRNIINKAADTYAKISEDWRQENFVVAISVIYFLHDREKEPDFLFSWLFQLLEHPNGNIRYAAVRMIKNELGPLTLHIRIPEEKLSELTPEQADHILYSLIVSLKELSSVLWDPKFKKYKYIDSLPACPFKSVQMLMAQIEECCGDSLED